MILVSDAPLLSEALASTLADHDMVESVRTARSNEAFLSCKPEPDVIILDATRPVLAALSAQADARGSAEIVVLVTAGQGTELHTLGRELGVVAYVNKDTDTGRLVGVILTVRAIAQVTGSPRLRPLPSGRTD